MKLFAEITIRFDTREPKLDRRDVREICDAIAEAVSGCRKIETRGAVEVTIKAEAIKGEAL